MTPKEKRLALNAAKWCSSLAWSIDAYHSAGGEWIIPKRYISIAETAARKLREAVKETK